MPITTIIFLSAIVSVFVIFGLVLAWGDRQTRHLQRDIQTRSPGIAKSSPLQSKAGSRVSEPVS